MQLDRKRFLTLAAGLAAPPTPSADAGKGNRTVGYAARVMVDRTRIVGRSRLEIGVTHTRYSLDTGGDPAAIKRSNALLSVGGCRLNNIHIMGWGTLNPSPAPGVYDWETLDRRVAMVRSIPGAVPVITLCAAPDWMKGGAANTTDWTRLEVAPKREHYTDFAALAATIARRYPDIRWFQVWNEMKGLWDSTENNWDYRAYTELYNRCYDALKRINPQNRVGGPYLVIEGTGGGKGPVGDATRAPFSSRNRAVLNYWLQHKTGADFLTLDRGITSYHDKNSYTFEERMRLTHWFADVERQVRSLTAASDLPLWWSELYASERGDSLEMKAAINASSYRHALLGGASVILLWQPMDTGEVGHALFTDVRKPDGGLPLPLFRVVKGFHEHFAPGTQLVATESSQEMLEVLASPQATLLINKSPLPVTVHLESSGDDKIGKMGKGSHVAGGSADKNRSVMSIPLDGYAVRFATI